MPDFLMLSTSIVSTQFAQVPCPTDLQLVDAQQSVTIAAYSLVS
jgi:hypothetical protein